MKKPHRWPPAIPAGEYRAAIVASEVKDTADKKGKVLHLELKVLDGEFADRRICEELHVVSENASAHRLAQDRLSAICQSIGVRALKESKQLHDIPMFVLVTVKEYKGARPWNQIKRYRPVDNAGPVRSLTIAPPTPPPAPEPTAEIAGTITPLSRVRLVRLSDVKPEKVRWMWPERIAYGKLTIIEGDPGLGKSFLTIEIAACISTGRALPEGIADDPHNVIFVTYEDGIADTIVPRVHAARGDPRRIQVLKGIVQKDGPDRLPCFPEDVPDLRHTIEATRAKMVVVDPLSAALSGEVNSWRDTDVRRALAPFKDLAEETGCAVVVIRHVTKSATGRAITAGGGSIGFIGQARTALLVDRDPKDEDRRVIAVIKNNLAKKPASLSFTLENAGDGCARVVWLGHSEYSADNLTAARAGEFKEGAPMSTSLEEAVDMLKEWVADGERPKTELLSLARAHGISQRTLERAKESLKLPHRREGFGKDSQVLWGPGPHTRQSDIYGTRGEYAEEVAGQADDGQSVSHTRQEEPPSATSSDLASMDDQAESA